MKRSGLHSENEKYLVLSPAETRESSVGRRDGKEEYHRQREREGPETAKEETMGLARAAGGGV